MFNKSISYIVFLSAFIFVFLFFPIASRAASVGFLPSSPIWYSPSTFSPGSVISVYTVIINNEYPSLSGVVGFFANGVEMNRVSFQNLKKDEAKELKVYWQPTSGDYTLSAKFITASVIDEQGNIRSINPDEISGAVASFSGQTLIADSTNKSSEIQIVSTSSIATQSTESVGVSDTITIKRSGSELVISPKKAEASFFESISSGKQKLDSALHFVTSTAATLNNTYEKTKAAVDEGHKYYTKAEGWWQTIQPYFAPAERVLRSITNDYEPRRIIYIFIALFILWLVFKIIRRQRTFDDYR